jgi:hypothetical protein
MEPHDDTRDDEAGYKGLLVNLPALDAFSDALCSGNALEELQLLYRAWAAGPQQQVSSTGSSLSHTLGKHTTCA